MKRLYKKIGWVLLWTTAACGPGVPTAPLTLDAAPNAKVWPAPPEKARYVFIRSLIGEKDFLDEKKVEESMKSTFAWLVGLTVGDADIAELQRPVSGMTDKAGNIYVTDASRQAVMVFDMADRRLLIWEYATKGQRFKAPIGIVDDGAGNFLVTDSELQAVFRLDAKGNPIGAFGAGLLSRPTGIARDPKTGRIFVADTNVHNIKIFSRDGALVDTFGARGDKPGQFNFPTHLAFKHGNLYVADTLNFRIQVLNSSGDNRLTFGRLGQFIGDLTRPKGVAVSRDGRIYVVESYFDHLLVYNKFGKLLIAIGGAGKQTGKFFLPSGVWTDDSGKVYVADMFNGRIVVLGELNGDTKK